METIHLTWRHKDIFRYIYRRYIKYYANENKSIYEKTLGFGSKTAFKFMVDDGLMEWKDYEPKPYQHEALRLTNKGVEAFILLIPELHLNYIKTEAKRMNKEASNYEMEA